MPSVSRASISRAASCGSMPSGTWPSSVWAWASGKCHWMRSSPLSLTAPFSRDASAEREPPRFADAARLNGLLWNPGRSESQFLRLSAREKTHDEAQNDALKCRQGQVREKDGYGERSPVFLSSPDQDQAVEQEGGQYCDRPGQQPQSELRRM